MSQQKKKNVEQIIEETAKATASAVLGHQRQQRSPKVRGYIGRAKSLPSHMILSLTMDAKTMQNRNHTLMK